MKPKMSVPGTITEAPGSDSVFDWEHSDDPWLTWGEEDNGFETDKFCVCDVQLFQRSHQLFQDTSCYLGHLLLGASKRYDEVVSCTNTV